MTVDQNEATTNLPSRRAFLTRVALLGVAAVMTFGVAETEAKADAGRFESVGFLEHQR